MSGRIYKRGSVYWIDYSHRGERHRESSESNKKKDAKALLEKRMGEIAQGKLPARDEEKLRLSDARETIVSDYEVNGRKTVKNVSDAFRHLERHLGDAPLLSVTTQRMRRYVIDRQAEGGANASIRKETAALK